MLYIIVLIIVALAGNYALRSLWRRVGRDDPDVLGKPSTVASPTQPNDILQRWGSRASARPPILGPVHSTILDILEKYGAVGPDKYFMPIDPQYATVPFKDNNDYIQIGVWGDGSAVVVRRDATDERIYLADVEDTGPQHPVVLAATADDFLRKAWDYHQDSIRRCK